MQNHVSLCSSSEEEGRISQNSNDSTPPKLPNGIDSRYFVLRSFKTMQALCEESNYKDIQNLDRDTLDIYCNFFPFFILNIPKFVLYLTL